MKTEELDAIETRVLVWSKEVNPQRREDALALIAEIRGHASDADLQFGVLRKAVEYYLDANSLECELSKMTDCKQCAVCHIRIAIEGPGRCCEGYAKHCDAHSIGCVFAKSRVDDRCCCTITVGEGPCPAGRKHKGSSSRNR